MGSQGFGYRVERRLVDRSHTEVALIRLATEPHHHGLRHHGRHRPPEVVFARTFRPLLEALPIEAYASELERVAGHLNAGTYGCFLHTAASGPSVDVRLYERWFDGTKLRVDELAAKRFDATDDESLVASAEFKAELNAWAEQRNTEREAREASQRAEAEARAARALEDAEAATQLAEILRRSG